MPTLLHYPFNQEGMAQRDPVDVSGNGYAPRVTLDYLLGFDTGTKKHGNASWFFDSSMSNKVFYVDPPICIGKQDFTIEFWFNKRYRGAYTADIAAYQRLIQFGPNVVNGGLWICANRDTADCRPFVDIYVNGWVGICPAQGIIASNAFHHLALCRSGSVWKLFINGALYSSGTYADYDIVSNTAYFGSNSSRYAEMFYGWMDDCRITVGEALYSTEFTPPDALPYAYAEPGSAPLSRETYQSAFPIPGQSIARVGMIAGTKDIYYSGNGKIAGTTKNTPAAPVSRRVRLHESKSGHIVREGWSDASGNYTFDYLSRDYTYYAVGFDHTGTYQGVVADKLVPEAM